MKKHVKITNQTVSLLSLTFLLTLLLSLTTCGSSKDAETPLDVTSSIEEPVVVVFNDTYDYGVYITFRMLYTP